MEIKKLSACYSPTTVAFVDDNRKFLDGIKIDLDPKAAIYKFFYDSSQALEFLTKYKADPFTNRCIIQPDDSELSLTVNVDAIPREIGNQNRYDQISVVILDYAMPGENGTEIAKQLQGSGLKVILLTGEATESRALELFNQGIIHHYIRKNNPHYTEMLIEAITRFQYEHSVELSKPVIESIINQSRLLGEKSSCLDDPVFIKLVHSLLDKHKITEHYLSDESGSYLFLNANGKLSWLIVKTEDQMEGMEYELSLDDYPIDDKLKKAIQNREVLKHCFNREEYPNLDSPKGWPEIFYPATKLVGKANYYYSFIEKPKTKPLTDLKKVATFNEHRKSSKK